MDTIYKATVNNISYVIQTGVTRVYFVSEFVNGIAFKVASHSSYKDAKNDLAIRVINEVSK